MTDWGQPACLDLAPAVFEKYFAARFDKNPFEYLTARTICQRCPVQLACLQLALQMPASSEAYIVAGEGPHAVRVMRAKVRRGEYRAAELAALVLEGQATLQDAGA